MKTKTSLHFFFSLCLLSLCSFIWGGNLLSAQTTVTADFSTDQDIPTSSLTYTKDNVTFAFTKNSNNYLGFYPNDPSLRVYNGATITISVPSGSAIEKIELTYKMNKAANDLSADLGNFTNNGNTTSYNTSTWTGEAESVVFTVGGTSGHIKLQKAVVTYSEGSSSGEGGSSEAQDFDFTNSTEEVYSDKVGTTLTNALTGEAKGAVTYTSNAETVATVDANGEVTIQGVGTATITATAAAATVEGKEYEKTSKSYTLHVWPTSIEELKSIITSSEADFKANLTDAYITYVPNPTNAYLQDATGAILIYKSSHGLTAGNCYTGEISGKTKKFRYLNEITDFNFSQATLTNKSDIAPQKVSMAELSTNFAQYESMYLKVTGVTAGAAVKTKGDECTLTQNGSDYPSPVLRAADDLTVGITAGTTYPAIVVFPAYYGTKEQLNLWSDNLVTLPAGTLKTPDVAFGATAYKVAINKAIKLTFNTDSDGDVTYTATPSENITLTKTNDGVSVTATATGTYTITANVAETATFATGSASTTLTVTPPAPNLQNVVLYKKVTSTDALIDGAQYLVVCESEKKALVAGDKNIHKATPASVTIEEEKISSENVAAGKIAEFTLGEVVSGTNTYYTLKTNGMYANWSSDTNITLVAEPNANKTNWDIAFDSNGNAEITNVATLSLSESTKRGILYRASTYNVFKCYSTGYRGDTDYPAIQLYQKVGELKAHGKMGGYASYAADFAYIMPEGLMGKIVYLEGDKLTTENIYAGNSEVPALTPLLIRTYEAFSGTDAVKTYYPIVLDKEVAKNDATDKNALEYRRDIVEGKYMTSSLNFAEGCRYYKLSVDNEGLNPGFYYGAADGAPFEMKNGSSAYLTVSASLASPALLFDDKEITGIENLTPAQGAANNGAVYNLQGVRMNGKNLQKGLYIINGKKVVIK